MWDLAIYNNIIKITQVKTPPIEPAAQLDNRLCFQHTTRCMPLRAALKTAFGVDEVSLPQRHLLMKTHNQW